MSRIKDIGCKDKETIVSYLKQNDYTTTKDATLAELLAKNPGSRGFQDLLNFLENDGILTLDKTSRPFRYRLKDKYYVVDHLSSGDAVELDYAMDAAGENFSIDTQNLLKRIFETRESVIGNLSHHEDIADERLQQHFNDLLEAVEKRLYVRLIFKFPKNAIYSDVRCLKMIFTDNNWYIFFDYMDEKEQKRKARFGRISFIKEIKFLKESRYSNKNSFQKHELSDYDTFYASIQNAMTLHGVKRTKATIKAMPRVGQYFDQGMKKFFNSQRFVKKGDDGSIVFTVEYTQALELMPFIQKWMPDLVVVEPKELQEYYRSNLKTMLERQA